MVNKLILIILVSGCLAACVSDAPKPTTTEDPCATIGQILESHKTQFVDIRGEKRSYNRIDIWSSSLQLVGNGCEIWGWQGGKYNYVCNYTAPDEATARNLYQTAAEKINTCAGPEWQQKEASTQQQGGRQTLWQKQGSNEIIDLKLVPTRAVSKPRCAIYLLLGDYNPEL